MIAAPIPANETARLQELYRMSVLDTQPDEEFNEIVEAASRICKVPISLISLIDHNRLWFKAKIGLDEPEMDRNIAFCSHTILGDSIMEIKDAEMDARFVSNPLVNVDPHIRFYAGIPLKTSNGYNLGSLCVIDVVPRSLNADQIFTLDVLSKQIIKLFELRLLNIEIKAKNAIVENQRKHLQELSDIQNKLLSIIAHDVRSPMASFKSMLELKKSADLSSAEFDDYVLMLSDQIDSTLNLLSNLVEWGGILLNKSNIQFTSIHFQTLVTEMLKDLRLTSSLKNNLLVNNVLENIWVNADSNMLKFILRNILMNAIKFTESGTIEVNAIEFNDRINIQITDSGIGMSKEISDHLFSTNRKSSRKGTNMEEGSGLGLILTREFARILGSQLSVKSEPNKGTIINFDLPKRNVFKQN